MDRSCDVSLVDTAECTHAYGAHALTIRLDAPDQRRNRLLSRGKARRQAPTLADGKILAQHSPFNGRTAHIDSKELLHIRSSRAIAPDVHRRDHHRGCPLMMAMQQIAPGADYLPVLRFYFGQTKQHILFTREVDAELALKGSGKPLLHRVPCVHDTHLVTSARLALKLTIRRTVESTLI